jgi:hypothetical protein
MIPVRRSPAESSNPKLRELAPKAGESNVQWLRRTAIQNGVMLIGGTSVLDFRVRIAQSHLRHDLLPSYWSLAGVLDGGRTLWTVPLGSIGDASSVPASNGIRGCAVAEYDDPAGFPNVAILDFGAAPSEARSAIPHVSAQRVVVDLVTMIVPWLAFVWGAGSAGNPLLESIGLPSAAFVEAVYGLLRLELTPNLSTQSSCPEAIWQSAKWWHGFYEETAQTLERAARREDAPSTPHGFYARRQPAAAVVESASPRRRRGTKR